ncbi:uncharacterized protein C11orf16 homolog isoform X2 [Eleutherodactylus coqui]|uniref:uncharacterized protein C11orf16 homolog isoform X2 n=1 Tax=Eleutherodactylus coqui TaxID=57060 RepID=UPI003461B4E4
MDPCVHGLCLDHKYCSVTAPLATLSCQCLVTHPPPLCSCTTPELPCVPTHHTIHNRCLLPAHPPHCSGVMCGRLTVSPRFPCVSLIFRRGGVLARREPDGFYYLGVAIQEEEPGVLLIEFTEPCVDGERFPAMLQKTRACDVIHHEEALRHCIVPGDNVLAPWEPQLTRYGPGTVILGLETRDPLRATEDEELTVSFWNGKKSTVPLRVAVWISPSVHYRIVDTLHRPISSRLSYRDTADRSATYSSAVAVPMCSADHAHKYRCHYHSIHSHLPTCCQDWWPLSPRTTVYIRGKKDVDEELLNPTMKTRARRCKERDRRSSSSSEAEGQESLDDESDDETCLSKTTQTTMVDSAVNTDSSLWEKQRLDTSDRPDWKYWKRNQPEPFYRKPGRTTTKSESSTSDLKAALSDIIGSSNQSALFEAISDAPRRRLTMKDVLVHTDFNSSQKEPSPPAVEHLGESELLRLRHKKEMQERQQKKKTEHLEWERKREAEAEEKYSESQEAHRMKTLQRLQKEEQKLKEQQLQNVSIMEARKAAQEERGEHHQTIAAADKKKEERRLAHLRKVRERIDMKELRKCVDSEERDRNHMEAQTRKAQDHYKQVAQRVYQAEQQGGRSRSRHVQPMEE